MANQVLAGKVGVVFGVANKRSIAWAIAKAWAAAGARLIFNYQGERLKENVEELVGEFGEGTPLFPCDVSSDAEIAEFFAKVRGETDRLDLMLHSVAFAPKEALEGDFVSTTREAFRMAHDISAYSLVGAGAGSGADDDERREHCRDDLLRGGKGGAALQCDGRGQGEPGSFDPLSGLRSRAEEDPGELHFGGAGPDAGGARDRGFTAMLKHYQEHAPLKRSCDPAELGETGVFLASDGAAAITGQVLYVDGGYQIMGM